MTTSTLARHVDPPAPVQAARALLALAALGHVAVAIVFAGGRDDLRATIAADHPDYSAADLTRAVDIAVTSGTIFHAVLTVVGIGLAVALGRPRRWARRVTIAEQVLAVGFGFVSWSTSPRFHLAIVAFDLAAAVVIGLLVVRPTRAWFARR